VGWFGYEPSCFSGIVNWPERKAQLALAYTAMEFRDERDSPTRGGMV
jgi:hypothetical protein